MNRWQTIHHAIQPKAHKLLGWTCARCGHQWAPRRALYQDMPKPHNRPVNCPKCKRRNWWIEAGILQKVRAT